VPESLVTVFTTPKPFRGHVGLIQRNAMRSWIALRPSCEVLVFGEEEGTAQVTADLGVSHVPGVARNEFGMPLIRSLFEQARDRSTTPFLCYVNADIMLLSDFVEALRRLAELHDRFLMIGHRYNADIVEPLECRLGWETQFRSTLVQRGIRLSSVGVDYFAYPRGLWGEIPESLVVGRAGWDFWPMYEARLRKAIVVDATQVLMAVHQNHDYSHHPDGKAGVYDGLEADRNYATMGGEHCALTIRDATHILTERELRIRCRSCYPMCACKPVSF
jgi:hypothetical protein